VSQVAAGIFPVTYFVSVVQWERWIYESLLACTVLFPVPSLAIYFRTTLLSQK